MLNVIHKVLVVLRVSNWFALALFLGLAAVLIAMPDHFSIRFAMRFGGDGDAIRQAMIGALLMVSLVVFPAHLIFSKLIAMIDTVRAGQPFSRINADRLRHIAWAVLAIQIIDLGFGWFVLRLSEVNDLIGWQVSIAGWLSVVLLFVLARVFQQGAAMQDELEGTV